MGRDPIGNHSNPATMKHTSTIFLLSLLTLAACSSTTEPTLLQEPYSKDQMIPLAVGNRWEYSRTGQTFHDEMIVDSITRVFSGYYYFTDGSAKGVVVGPVVFYSAPTYHGLPRVFTVFDKEIDFGYIVGGDTVMRTVTSPYKYPKEPVLNQTMVGGAFTFTAQDSVTVPAGTFPNAFRYEYKYTTSPPDSTVNTRRIWFARGVGIIKMEFMVDGQVIGGRELVRYRVK